MKKKKKKRVTWDNPCNSTLLCVRVFRYIWHLRGFEAIGEFIFQRRNNIIINNLQWGY
jgi:hypothetical protein